MYRHLYCSVRTLNSCSTLCIRATGCGTQQPRKTSQFKPSWHKNFSKQDVCAHAGLCSCEAILPLACLLLPYKTRSKQFLLATWCKPCLFSGERGRFGVQTVEITLAAHAEAPPGGRYTPFPPPSHCPSLYLPPLGPSLVSPSLFQSVFPSLLELTLFPSILS